MDIPPKNIIGLDYGQRRIGVALANKEARIAEPLLTLDCQKILDIFQEIARLMKSHEASTIVVGLPRGMDGQETAQTANARQFAAELEKATGATVYLQDEAATSLAAEDELKSKGKQYEKGDIDKLAATIILQDWLDGVAGEITQ